MKKDKKEGAILWENVRALFYAIILAVVIRTFAFEPFHIPSGSMIPTLLIGDYLFIKKWTYGFSRFSLPFGWFIPYFQGRILDFTQPEVGDIIIFRAPTEENQDFVKRLIGKPGDRIQMKNGVLYINDVEATLAPMGDYTTVNDDDSALQAGEFIETLPNGVQHQIIKQIQFGYAPHDNTPVFIVPEGHYFMMGDNRDGSDDSRGQRKIGFIPYTHIIGTPAFIFFSTGGHIAIWEFWKWLTAANYSRIFKVPH